MLPTLHLGDFELTVLSDGTYYLDGGTIFGIIPKPLWEKKMPADERNRVSIGLNSLLIRTGKQNILVETGIGNKLGEKQLRIYHSQAKLLESLQAAGIQPAQIDIVINSHLHFDHCGWNTVIEGGVVVPTFPNARYYAPEGELQVAHQQRERDRVSYLSDNYDPLIRSGQMQLLQKDGEIVPGISVCNYPGHTRAMMAVLIESRGQKACYVSDLIPTTAHLDLVWGMAYDLFPLETIENKRRYYKQAIPEKWLTIFTHDPKIPWGYLHLNEQQKIAVTVASS
ncbi:MAG TPA: MBL fold metallo-hydrolase [Terriglobales bacterium]|jgi:glyoxylase-like metal-dependent hydrolase (beta-lactamase superfamily II)|nr:MBL fold metallo-hydrolase [Terriglobales bacterium]